MDSLLVLVFHSYYSYFLPHSQFPCFLCFSYLFSFFSLFLLFFPCSMVRCCCLLCTAMAFYTATVTRFTIFILQLLLACCGRPSWTVHWFAGCPATNTTLRWPCHASFPDKSSFCFVFYFPCTLIRIRAGFLSYQLL